MPVIFCQITVEEIHIAVYSKIGLQLFHYIYIYNNLFKFQLYFVPFPFFFMGFTMFSRELLSFLEVQLYFISVWATSSCQ